MSDTNGSGKIAFSWMQKAGGFLFVTLVSVIGFLLVLGLSNIEKNQVRIETKLDVFIKEMNTKIDGDNGLRERVIRLEVLRELEKKSKGG